MGMWRAAASGAMAWSLLFGARSAGADAPKDCAPCKASGDCLPAGHPGRTFSGADNSFTDGLIEVLENDRDEEHRLAAVAQLVQVPRYRPEILRALEEASRMDPSIQVRRAALLGVPRYRVASKIAKMSNEPERKSLKRSRAPQALLTDIVPSGKSTPNLAASSKAGVKRKPSAGAKAPGAGTALAKTGKPRPASATGKAVAKATPKSGARPKQPKPSHPNHKEIVTVRRHETQPEVAPAVIPSFRFTNDDEVEVGTITITEAKPTEEAQVESAIEAHPVEEQTVEEQTVEEQAVEEPEVPEAELATGETWAEEPEMVLTNDSDSWESSEPDPADGAAAVAVEGDERSGAMEGESQEPELAALPEPSEFTNDPESAGEQEVVPDAEPTVVAASVAHAASPQSHDEVPENSYPPPSPGREKVGGPGPKNVASAPPAEPAPHVEPAPPAPVTPAAPAAVTAIPPAEERPLETPMPPAVPEVSRTIVERERPVPTPPSAVPMRKPRPVATRPKPSAGPKSAFTALIPELEGSKEKTRSTRRVVTDPRRSLATLEDRLAHRPDATAKAPAPSPSNEVGHRRDSVRPTQRVVSSPAGRKPAVPAADSEALAASHALSRAGRDLVVRHPNAEEAKIEPPKPLEPAIADVVTPTPIIASVPVAPAEPPLAPPAPAHEPTTVVAANKADSPSPAPAHVEAVVVGAVAEVAPSSELSGPPAPAPAPAAVATAEPPRWAPNWATAQSAARTEPTPKVESSASTSVPVAKTVLARTDAPPILRSHGMDEAGKPKTPAMLSLEAAAPKSGSRKRFASPIKFPVASLTPSPAPAMSAPVAPPAPADPAAPPAPAAMAVAVEKLPALPIEPERAELSAPLATEAEEPAMPVAVDAAGPRQESGDVVAAIGAESDESDEADEGEAEAAPEAPSLYETPRLGTVLARESRAVHRPELALAAGSTPPVMGEKGESSSLGAVASSPPPVPGKARTEKRRAGDRNRAVATRQPAQTVAYVVPPGARTPMAVPLAGAGGTSETDEELAERLVHQCKGCISDQRFDEAEMLIYRIRDLEVDWDEFETSPRDLLLELSQARFEPGGK